MGRRKKGHTLMATTPNRSWPTPDDTDLVRDGASAIRALGDAIDGTVGQGFVFAGTRYYESSGQFEKADPLGTGDIGLRAIRVTCVGGGAGGGSRDAFGGMGAGGAGGYGQSFITDIAGLDTSVTVTRGAGGTGATAGGENANPGGASSFGSLVIAPGGDAPPDGVTRSGGQTSDMPTADLAIPGGAGGNGWSRGKPEGDFNPSGMGGNNPLGFGGRGGIASVSADDGSPGSQYGGGGGGAFNISFDVQGAGGDGAPGIVIVDCFV